MKEDVELIEKMYVKEYSIRITSKQYVYMMQ